MLRSLEERFFVQLLFHLKANSPAILRSLCFPREAFIFKA
jgi:hypothetical protein